MPYRTRTVFPVPAAGRQVLYDELGKRLMALPRTVKREWEETPGAVILTIEWESREQMEALRAHRDAGWKHHEPWREVVRRALRAAEQRSH